MPPKTLQLRISAKELQKATGAIAPNRDEWREIGDFLIGQVRDRFRTQGRSGNVLWPEKQMKVWGHNDGRAILTGTSGDLLAEWQFKLIKNGIQLFNPVRYAHVHQEGTVGKGGTLPTIVPVTAKALFIPVTDRAKKSERLTGSDAMFVRRHGGMSKMRGAVRVHPPSWPDTGLRKGRLKDGALEVWDEKYGDYVQGTPDFFFLSKVDIPPRPMLPDSEKEKQAQLGFVYELKFGERR